jgi:hypothetical protein
VRVNPVVAAPAPPPAVRPRAPDPSANPAAWSWRIVSRSIQEKLVAAAAFSANGDSIVGVGPSGLARWSRGAWSGFLPPSSIDVRDVRGMKLTPEGDLILFGERSLATRISVRGAAEVFTLPSRDLSLRAVHVWNDVMTLVGERASRGGGESVGAAVQLTRGNLTFAIDAPTVPRLNGVTRVEGGMILAVGDRGTLARLDRGGVELVGSICRGHLVAIEALVEGGAVTVGGGGHALYVSPRLDAQLEAVQTTRDLCALAIGGGAAWAGAAQARLLRREASSWVRMSGDVGITPRIVAIWASDPLVRAVCDDGAVLEGRAA